MIRHFWLSLSAIRSAPRSLIFMVTVVTVFWCPFQEARADDNEKRLVFRENTEYAPYIYRHAGANGSKPSAPQGYIPTLLKYFSDDHGITVDYVEMPRNRVESAYEKNQLDASILNNRWVNSPDDFVFSQPLGLYRTVIFTSDASQRELVPLTNLKSQYVCAHRGYRYPNLDLLWDANNLIRVDFSDEKLQLQGLVAERCQYAVMDEGIGRWYMKKFFTGTEFSVVSEESQVPLTIGFRKDNAHYAELFDSTISRLKANGELAILQRVFGVTPFQDRNQTQ